MTINERINELAKKIAEETQYRYVDVNLLINAMLQEGCNLDRIEEEYKNDGICGIETYRTINFMGLDF